MLVIFAEAAVYGSFYASQHLLPHCNIMSRLTSYLGSASDAAIFSELRNTTMIPCQRHLFDIPEDVAYFNCAYMSPLLKNVVSAGQDGVARKAQPWRITPPDFFAAPERARALLQN